MVSQGVKFLHKNGPFPLWLTPHMTLKSPPNLNALPSSTNMTTMIRQHTKFPPTASSPRQPGHQAMHCPTGNFGWLPSGNIINLMLITAYDTYLNPRSPGAWCQGWVPTLSRATSEVWTKIVPVLNALP